MKTVVHVDAVISNDVLLSVLDNPRNPHGMRLHTKDFGFIPWEGDFVVVDHKGPLNTQSHCISNINLVKDTVTLRRIRRAIS